MKLLVSLLGIAGMGAIITVLVIMGRLTQRWELVTRSKSHYYLFFVSAALIGVALLGRLIRAGNMISDTSPTTLSDPRSWLYISVYYVPLTIGMTMSLVVTWRNWGWLLREQTGREVT